MATGPSIIIGFRDPHFAIVTKDDDTGIEYEAPIPMGGLVTGSITPTVNTSSFYSNDSVSATNTAFGGAEVSIEMDALSADVRNKLLGITKNAKGVLEYKGDDQAPYVAFGFKAPLSSGGFRYVWLKKGVFAVPEDSYTTKGESVEYQTKTLTGTFMPTVADGIWKVEVDSNDLAVGDETVATDWFTEVYNGN